MSTVLKFTDYVFAAKKKVHRQGALSKSRYSIPANDPLKVEARRRKRAREATPALPQSYEAMGLSKETFKRLNREYREFRTTAFDKNIIAPSYNDWMRERLKHQI